MTNDTAREAARQAKSHRAVFDPQAAIKDISDDDWRSFNQLTSVELTEPERELAANPDRFAPEAEDYLAVHWHPEWAPLELVGQRLERAFPEAKNYLAIPTQHNRIMSLGPWAGVEADVYDRRYDMKVQLLIHFKAEYLPKAGTLLAMMNRTYNYRAHQLLDILDALAKPGTVKPGLALKGTVCDESMLMARFYALRLKAMIEESGIIGSARGEMLKNRLLPDFILSRLGALQQPLADQAAIYINAVKKSVKKALSPYEFYSPEEVIEEARALKAGIVIPHPPLFWPILLSGLDVDGWEIWNPSSPDHTLFLLEALNRANEARLGRRKLLVFMGDDTHMSAKFRRNIIDDHDSSQREIGFQDQWAAPEIKLLLAQSGHSLQNTINEYRQRLS